LFILKDHDSGITDTDITIDVINELIITIF